MPDKSHRYYFLVRTPDEIYDMANVMASFSSNPEDVVTGIYELLINAIEHGNLGIGFMLKSNLLREGKWHEEISHRLNLPENREKMVQVEVVENERHCHLTIVDMGKGFNWKTRLQEDADETRPHGRGLIIAMNAGFESLTFNDPGNSVTCRLKAAH